jgi:hypothetical protein
LVGVDLNLDAGLKWGAEAELIRNPVLVEGAPYFLFYFTKFDVDAYAELPADGFFLDDPEGLGKLFSESYPLLRLPEAQSVNKKNICKGNNAIKLLREAKNKKPNPAPLIMNEFEPTHSWKVDFDPKGVGVTSIVAPSYVAINDKTTQVTLALPRSQLKKVEYFQIPTGSLYF